MADALIGITGYSVATALGRGQAPHVDALRNGRSGLSECDVPGVNFPCYIGRVAGVEDDAFPAHLAAFDNRASRLSEAALAADGFADDVDAARLRWGADRCGLVMGTTTSGVEVLELAYRARAEGALDPDYSLRHHNDHHAVTEFVAERLQFDGPAYTISTACSSSAKALIDAVQLIELGVCDVVVAGGVDSLCYTSLFGFEGLQLVSSTPCQPCDKDRNGLSIGEGAAFILVERDARTGLRLSGFGESSDGFNMSTPPNDGAGAAAAIEAALASAGIAKSDVDYVNLHGTATAVNDTAECAAVARVIGPTAHVGSLKGAVGHTLGAAGAVEIVLCLIAMEEKLAPASVGLNTLDPAIDCSVVMAPTNNPMRHVLSNAFGFGGNNTSVILSQ